jgi:exosortase/archaeosortase family protein
MGKVIGVERILAPLGRNELFAGLCIVAFANGTIIQVIGGLRQRPWVDLFSNTFEISAIVWVALVVGVVFLLRQPRTAITNADRAVAAAAAAAFLVPVAPLSWLALSGIAVHILRTTPAGSFPHRGGWILLAVTVPMFWSRVLFSLFSGAILEIDAILVSRIVGTERVGNAIEFADGSGYLWIAPSCSSLANISLAALCSVLAVQLHSCEQPIRQVWWAVLACAAVVSINIVRLSLIGLYSGQFDLLHGPAGATVANWLTFAAIVGICAIGIRHDRLAQQ